MDDRILEFSEVIDDLGSGHQVLEFKIQFRPRFTSPVFQIPTLQWTQ